MGMDNISLSLGKDEIPLGIPQGKAMMLEAVPAKALVRVVPIVKIIIVKQRSADQRAYIARDIMAHRKAIRLIRHLDAVLIDRDIGMGYVLLHFIVARLADDLARHLRKQLIIYCLFHFFSPHFCWICSR